MAAPASKVVGLERSNGSVWGGEPVDLAEV